jgi:PRTRC genetic system protein C
MEIALLQRKFTFQGNELPDPDPTMSVAEVVEFYSGRHPELAAAVIKEPVMEGNVASYNLEYSVGNKA